jgi:hypothetical protein
MDPRLRGDDGFSYGALQALLLPADMPRVTRRRSRQSRLSPSHVDEQAKRKNSVSAA